MKKYHINPETGSPGVCQATGACPFGDLEKDHYSTRESARAAYENKSQVNFINNMFGVSKNTIKTNDEINQPLNESQHFDKNRTLSLLKENNPAAADILLKEGLVYSPIANPVKAQKLTDTFQWQSTDGNNLVGEKGDYLIESDGNRWTVQPEIFEKTYSENSDGTFTKTAQVIAVKVNAALTINTLEGESVVHEGDYLLCGESADVWSIDSTNFVKKYFLK